MIMEAEKSQDLQLASCRLKGAKDVSCSLNAVRLDT